ncbi:DUF992 domain-containing protein [Alsobacter soli]|nr:DUF992 domain-containing protein [Alsobacter soli]
MSIRTTLRAAALATAGLVAGTLMAAPPADAAVKVGALRCNVSGSLGLIITSAKTMACTFTPSRGPRETYVGTIRRFGLDIGATERGVLAWGVFAPTSAWPRGALAGSYGGASAEATAGAGVSANALIGGNNNTISLQPISIGAQVGANLAVGVSALELRPTR